MGSEKVIDLALYNLVYTRDSDKRVFLCRSITRMDYALIDTVTGDDLRLTKAKLNRWYSPVKELNRVNKRRQWLINYGRKRIV